jgi:acyl carrier protein
MLNRTKDRSAMSLKLTIMNEMAQIAREHGRSLAPLRDDLVLIDSGLDSLGFAVLVARLEDRLGIDPFSATEETLFPVTFGDFVKVYENAAC